MVLAVYSASVFRATESTDTDSKMNIFFRSKIVSSASTSAKGYQLHTQDKSNRLAAVKSTQTEELSLVNFTTKFKTIMNQWETVPRSSKGKAKNVDITIDGRAVNLCKSQFVMPGKWTKLVDSRKKKESSFHCCSRPRQMNDTALDLVHCGPPEDYDTSLKIRISHHGSKEFNMADESGCSCQDTIIDDYDWTPLAGCSIIDWDAELFCKSLGNKTLMMVGDSTMRQSAAMLMSLIATHYRMQGRSSVSCSDQLFYGSSDVLVMPHKKGLPRWGRIRKIERGLPLLVHLARVDPDIVIISTGAHLYSLSQYQEYIQQLLQNQLIALRSDYNQHNSSAITDFVGVDCKSFLWNRQKEACRQSQKIVPSYKSMNSTKPLHIVWRTATAGHLRCMPSLVGKDPFTNLRHVEMSLEDPFKRYLHPLFDDIGMIFSRSMGLPIIDMRPMYYRVDAHPWNTSDCLHYCMPQPVDLFSRVLLNMMVTGEIFEV